MCHTEFPVFQQELHCSALWVVLPVLGQEGIRRSAANVTGLLITTALLYMDILIHGAVLVMTLVISVAIAALCHDRFFRERIYENVPRPSRRAHYQFP